MTKSDSSWNDRRWKIFENVYATEPKFRDQLLQVYNEVPFSPEKLEDLLIEYGVPIYCKMAAIIFLGHPYLERHEYLQFIRPPITYWNADAEYMGPSSTSPAQYYKRLCERLEKETGVNDFLGVDYKKLDFEALVHFISNNATVIHLTSFLKKTEIKELIDDYWDELELLLNYRYKAGDKLYSPKLLGNIQKSPKEESIKMKELLLELTEKGENDNRISWLLTEAGLGTPSTENIRLIRHRLNKKQAKKNK